MKLTVVTVTWNAIRAGNRESLIRCVKSVASLKTEHEHLIYDGASTDGTVELLRELESSIHGLKVVSEPDTGIYNAMNKCVRDAQGEWMNVIGCDDYYSQPERLDEILVESNEDVNLLVCEIDRDYGYQFFRSESDLNNLFFGVPCAHAGMLMRVETARKYGVFDESFKMGADMNLFFSFLENNEPLRVVYKAFANVAHGGAAEVNESVSTRDLLRVFSDHVCASQYEKLFFNRFKFYSLITYLKIINHANYLYRVGARKILRRWMYGWGRILLYPLVVATRSFRKK